VVGQDILEDRFNSDWAESKLYILADEIVAGADKYHAKNRIKTFVTGKTIRINPKNLAAHNENNHRNLVFLSNELFPVVLESDDRRHCVIWTPPELPQEFYDEVDAELQAGGVEALHYYLVNLDLGDFKPWTKPPMTAAKEDLINLGLSSEERFIRAWSQLEIEGENGEPLPFCPCQGSHLYKTYERWCRSEGELRPRPANHFLNYVGKLPRWKTGSLWTFLNLKDRRNKKRRMVLPHESDMQAAARLAAADSLQPDLIRRPEETQTEWLTRCCFAFSLATGVD
jgi:putative DNA primase/helicase